MNESKTGVLWDRYGPRLEMTREPKGTDPRYAYRLKIGDLNPLADVTWCFSRWQMVKIGIWFIRRALFARPE